MAGLVPAIRVLSNGKESKDVDHRDKRGDDGFWAEASWIASRPSCVGQCTVSLASPDLLEFRLRLLELPVEEPHRVENFAEGGRCSGSVSLAEGKDAVVSQVFHDHRIGNPVVEQIAGRERRSCRGGNDLYELKKLHLIDRVRKSFRDRRYLQEQVGVCVHQAVSD